MFVPTHIFIHDVMVARYSGNSIAPILARSISFHLSLDAARQTPIRVRSLSINLLTHFRVPVRDAAGSDSCVASQTGCSRSGKPRVLGPLLLC